MFHGHRCCNKSCNRKGHRFWRSKRIFQNFLKKVSPIIEFGFYIDRIEKDHIILSMEKSTRETIHFKKDQSKVKRDQQKHWEKIWNYKHEILTNSKWSIGRTHINMFLHHFFLPVHFEDFWRHLFFYHQKRV